MITKKDTHRDNNKSTRSKKCVEQEEMIYRQVIGISCEPIKKSTKLMGLKNNWLML